MDRLINTPIINRVKFRMDREIHRCLPQLDIGNLIYLVLKREQISQRYLRLMQEAMRRG
jgi:hypothetical protein